MTVANTCVECVGSAVAGGNERGVVDARCSNSTGTAPGTADVQTCAADNTWTAGTLDCVVSGKTCTAASAGPGLVDTCRKENKGNFFTDSYIRAHSGRDCTTSNRGNMGAPTACGLTADCCGSQCQRAYTPATCR